MPHVKATAGQPTNKMPVPEHVVIPMSMHIGAPAEPVVKKGDTVMVGTVIGKAGGFVSANIYSSVSGTVQDIAPLRMVNGAMTTAVAIKTDGAQTVDPACVPPVVTDKASLLAAVQACGLVGVGGAGFPTHVKLAANTIDTLLINAAECEPYLTTDCREMLECSDTIISGITAVMKYCEIPHCIIGIERNKPECIDLLTSLTREMKGVEVKGLPMRYPQGAEKTLVETCTGREVPQVGPSGKPGLPADVGCVIMNVTSVSTLGKFLKTGIPLVTKRVTVEGDAIARPQNIEVPIGTLYRDVIDACGGVKEGVELGKIIFGGPMMGGAAPSADFPVLKQNNGLLLFSKKAAVLAAGLIFGVQALVLVAVTTLACVAFEYIYEKLLKKSNTVGDLSAVVTGIILALNMPVGMPLWIAVVGAFIAIVITKQLFGGLGYNFANPALVGRIVLFLGFTSRMTAYVYPDMAVDALASATPLAVADKTTLPLLDVFLGFRGGMMGEVCVLAILLGFAYLVATRTIQATIPVTIVATVFVLTALNTGSAYTALIECMSGGLLFGAVFMATDYVTSPFTTKGKLFYGVFIGLITFLIRHFGSMNEGMSYAILLGNLMTPWFNAWGHQTPLGYKKPKKAKKGGAE